jgi:hypothetical protein
LLLVDQSPAPSENQIKGALYSLDVRTLYPLVEGQLYIVAAFLDDALSLKSSYNRYIANIKKILTKAKSISGLNFDAAKIDAVILT